MSHVFISYVRQDMQVVERLCNDLGSHGVRFWVDQRDLSPGARWKIAIRKAIQEGDFFLACFSATYTRRNSTYMNEELTLAIEILRQKRAYQTWFIPVLLEDCQVPEREIGAGETLLDLQFVRLYENWDDGVKRIVSVVKPVKEAGGMPPISVLFVATNPERHILRVDRELRDIQKAILLSRGRNRFDFRAIMAVRPADLRRALLDSMPKIVHFAGHAITERAIVLEDDSGNPAPISVAELSNIFAVFTREIDCVILNMCYSASYAEAIARQIRYAIGVTGKVSDAHATEFAVSFFQALADEKSIPVSFEHALVSIELAGGPKSEWVLFSSGA